MHGIDKMDSAPVLTEEGYTFSEAFTLRRGHLFCEEINVNALRNELVEKLTKHSCSPFFLFSKQQLMNNVCAYKEALEECQLPYLLGYSVKANYNASILKLFNELGCTAVAVGGHEIELAIRVGMDPEKVVYNGNGKVGWEVELAVNHGCFLNIDSHFDLRHTIAACKKLNKTAKIILRLNPDIDPVSVTLFI